MLHVRPPAVAGSFYPQPAAVLARDVQNLLAGTTAKSQGAPVAVPKAIIVPHAGYIYSGSTAALAYARLATARSRIRRVILLGPVHRVAVRGRLCPALMRLTPRWGASRSTRPVWPPLPVCHKWW